MAMIDIRSLYLQECRALMEQMGEKPFRGAQVYSWLHHRLVTDFDQMTDLSSGLRQRLTKTCTLTGLEPVRELVSQIDGTRKYAFALADGNVIESVFMKYRHGNSVCISSQVGCRMGCRFCASTIDGLARDLTASEMLEQVYAIDRLTGERVSNVVIMGSGEPLDNYDNVVRFLRLISDEKGYNMSIRNITLSTCGLVPRIRQLADEGLGITLAISLHAPNDELRAQTMPIARSYSIDEILQACEYYFDNTGRRISFEYSLISGLNDSQGCAQELAALLKGRNCHVNLIPVNEIKERDFRKSSDMTVAGFQKILEKNGINVTIRRRLGADIDSACGQLRRSVAAARKEI